jgi:dihydrofolate reductase
MRKLIYSMGVSLDGFIAGPGGDIGWSGDEVRPIVHPVVLGAGTPFLPALDAPLKLRLLETHTFGSGVVYLRYEIGAGPP